MMNVPAMLKPLKDVEIALSYIQINLQTIPFLSVFQAHTINEIGAWLSNFIQMKQ